MVLPALQVRVPNPANALLQAEQIKGARAQSRSLARQERNQNALIGAFQSNDFQTPEGRRAIVGQLAQTAPQQALNLQQAFGQLSAQDQAKVAAEGQQTARALVGVRDQTSYAAARTALGPLGQNLPEQYDPSFVQSTINQARSIDSLLQRAPGFTLSPDQTRFDAAGNVIASAPAASAAPDPQDIFNNANTLRDEFVKQTDDFAEAQTGFQRVQVGAAQNSGQGDVALVFGFMKTIDPASTVREGEFATAENTGSAAQRFVGLYNNILRGERLTPEQRQGFVEAAQAQFEAQRQTYDQTVSEYTRLANIFGLPPANVIVNRALEDTRAQSATAPSGPTPAAGRDISTLGAADLDELLKDPRSLSDTELLAIEERLRSLGSGGR